MPQFETPVYYNNFNLSALDGISCYDYDASESPSRTLNVSKLARADTSLLTSAEYTTKTVTINGNCGGIDRDTTEANFETLKGILQVPEGTLRFRQAGLQIEYVGTLNGITKSWFGYSLQFQLQFLCSQPIGNDRLITTLLTETNTVPVIAYPVTVDGSFKAQPNFSLSFTSITGGTGGTVQIMNADSGQGIAINEDFTTGDILDIDVDNKVVTLNASIVDYTGIFPTFYPGARSIQYIDTFTDRSVDITVTYNKQFA